jgi:hypothetical protein
MPRSLFYIVLAISTAYFAADSGEYSLKKTSKLPDGVSPGVAAAIAPQGYAVATGEGTACEVWIAKELPAKAGFKPTLNVKYPFEQGELVGLLRVGEQGEFSDFRGQPIKPGVYTLRYGQQPQDGNHIGTSELSDFLLAIPAADDKDPKPFDFVGKLHKASAKSAGTNHPAIFSLLPAEAPVKEAALEKGDGERWVLNVPAQTTQADKKLPLSLRLIVIGKAEG